MAKIDIYITLNQPLAENISQFLGGNAVAHSQEADVCIVFYKNPGGGVETVAEHINDPADTIVVAGTPNKDSYAFADEAIKLGVPPRQVLFTPPEGIDVTVLSSVMQGIQEKPVVPITTPKRIVDVPKLIGVIGCKGGIGRTTIAASLVAHYSSISEKAVLLDMCQPANGKYHLPEEQVVSGTSDKIQELMPVYRRIVVDVPPMFADLDLFEKIVVVVSADIIQSVEPTKKFLEQRGILPTAVVYNCKKPEIPEEMLKLYFESFGKVPLVSIDEDFAGCSAALTAQSPALLKSQGIAQAVGFVAAAIDGQRGENS